MGRIIALGTYAVPGHANVHLLEMEVSDFHGTIDLVDFAQPLKPGQDPDLQQVPYWEHRLNDLGEVAGELGPGSIVVDGSIRLAFFLHGLDFNEPVVTPFGDLRLLTPSPIPERLQGIKYWEPD